MDLLEFPQFVLRTRSGWRRQVDLSRYADQEYECACGATHAIAAGTQAIRELAGKRFVVVCPDERGLTCIGMRGAIRARITSLFGTPLDPDADADSAGHA